MCLSQHCVYFCNVSDTLATRRGITRWSVVSIRVIGTLYLAQSTELFGGGSWCLVRWYVSSPTLPAAPSPLSVYTPLCPTCCLRQPIQLICGAQLHLMIKLERLVEFLMSNSCIRNGCFSIHHLIYNLQPLTLQDVLEGNVIRPILLLLLLVFHCGYTSFILPEVFDFSCQYVCFCILYIYIEV